MDETWADEPSEMRDKLEAMLINYARSFSEN